MNRYGGIIGRLPFGISFDSQAIYSHLTVLKIETGILMIVFDLKCSNGHIFEGWFKSITSYQQQMDGGFIACPLCDDKNIEQVPSTFGIKSSPPDKNTDKNKVEPANEMEILKQQVIKFVENNFENVGVDFAKEALKIHYGVSEARNIRGVSTETEEKLLKKEGVKFTKIPVPEISDPDTNTNH
jgi:hypothetical protein